MTLIRLIYADKACKISCICSICVPSREHVSLLLDSTLMRLIRLIYADKACNISDNLLYLR